MSDPKTCLPTNTGGDQHRSRYVVVGSKIRRTDTTLTTWVLDDIREEREAQDHKWGEQNHPSGTSPAWTPFAESSKAVYENASSLGSLTWVDILREEVMEAFAETDPARLREELVQVAAVAAAWIECLDRNRAKAREEARALFAEAAQESNRGGVQLELPLVQDLGEGEG